MLRQTILLLFFSITTFLAYSQTIENLRTEEEVLAFIRNIDKTGGKAFITALKPVFEKNAWKSRAKRLKAVTYEKADFDHNGHTDLLFNGFYDSYFENKYCSRVAIVVLSFDKDSFQCRILNRSDLHSFSVAKVIEIAGQPHIQLINKKYFYNEETHKAESIERTDTLVYKYNDFLELSAPANHIIEKVAFSFQPVLGLFNAFNITLTPDSAIFSAGTGYITGEFFDHEGGTFITDLDPQVRTRIMDLLQYIRFPELEKQYACHCTDAPLFTLSINYDGGKVKQIFDQGLSGTYGLTALQNALYELKNIQIWKRINKIGDLHTNEQVLSFIKTLDSAYAGASIIRPTPILEYYEFVDSVIRFGASPWEKADFDHNGLTDLLFNGYTTDTMNDHWSQLSLAILDMGKDSFRVKPLIQYRLPHFAARTITIDSRAYIKTYKLFIRYNEAQGKYEEKHETDTLTYMLDELIELSRPRRYPIEEIKYCVYGGFPQGRSYRVEISGDSAIMEIGPKVRLDSLVPGYIAVARMDTTIRNRIYALLQYMDCNHLKEYYTARWTDDNTGMLSIKYDGGKLKKVYDYGLMGTYGLEVLHNILWELKKTLHWKVIKSTNFFSCYDE